MAKKTGSKLPWKVWKECLKLSKGVNKELALYSPIEFLEHDIQVRETDLIYSLQKSTLNMLSLYQSFSRMDTIHPNYQDKVWNSEII